MKFDIKKFEERLNIINQFDGNLVYGAKKFHSQTNRTGKGRPSSGGLTREQSKIVIDTGAERYQRIGEYWEEVKQCPVCGHEEREFFLSRLGMDIYECDNCTHRYMDPRVTFEKACELYSDDKTASDIYTQPIQKDIDQIKYEYGLELVEQLTQGRDKIIDIGTGAGFFPELAGKRGWKKSVGVDINQRYKDVYEDIEGVQFVNSTFEGLSREVVGDGYDCISMWGTLEHLYDLSDITEKVYSLLKDGGLFFVLVPNVESLATRLMREKSPTFMWKHVSHFSPASLEYLMEKTAKFKTVHLETVITEIDNVKSYMSGKHPYYGYGDPAGLFDFITPEYIHKNKLGSRLIGIFKK